MAQEQSLRVFRQASDDAREMAMRVSSPKSNFELMEHQRNTFF